MPASAPSPTVSVVVCAYTERRWTALLAGLAAVRAQTLAPGEILVVIDRNPALHARLAALGLPGVQVLANADAQGAAGARNTGIRAATGDLLAFLDDDAIPRPDWLRRVTLPFAEPRVAAVGGASRPAWLAGGRPPWFPPEFDWVVSCAYPGQPARPGPIRNVWGCNMCVRRSVLAEVGLFDTALGRVGTFPAGCEETELCIRIAQRVPGSRILYQPSAVVLHQVPAERARWGYFLARCYREGASKARMVGMVGAGDGLELERTYVRQVLPRAVARNLVHACTSGLPAYGLGRTTAIVTGSLITLSGYIRHSARRAPRSRSVVRVPAPAAV